MLAPPSLPRPGRWHTPCQVCGQPFAPATVIVPVLMPDGSRPYVCASHLESGEVCRHGRPLSACQRCTGNSWTPLGRTFRCRRPGECIVCRQAFPAGTLISRFSGTRGRGYGHAHHIED